MLRSEEGSSPGTPCLGGTFAEGQMRGHLNLLGLSTPLPQGERTGPNPEIQRLHGGVRFESQTATHHV